eukprot:COSAG04_NODE_5234_length_1691_cov_1.807789_4_plen_102_part_00
MEWLTEHEQFVFETHGFCVVVTFTPNPPTDSSPLHPSFRCCGPLRGCGPPGGADGECVGAQEDVLSPDTLAAMNQWLDDHPEAQHVRPPEQVLSPARPLRQ